jgi:hypothetical protein
MPVNLSPIAGAGWQFFDNSGAVLAGGLLYTYAAGTTTPLATYQDSSGSTVHTNPIILDSAGRVPTEVWMTAGSTYKLVLKTSAAVSLWTMDNLRGINDVAAVAWAAITGKPTTVAGFGITDALTTSVAASTYAPLASPTFTGTASAKDELNNTYNIGWRDCPQNLRTTSYQSVLADRGKQIYMNGATLTLTVSSDSTGTAPVAYPIGTTMMIVNGNSTALSIQIAAAPDTITLANSTTTGSRTLAQNGVATLTKIGTTSWLIAGTGLT